MYGRIHPDLDVDLYLQLEEFQDMANPGLERLLSCELPTLVGSYTGKKTYLQCEDLSEDDVLRVECRGGDYFIKIARRIPDIMNEKGHFGKDRQTDRSVTVYIFERSTI